MKATSILQDEHRVILRVLQCLSAAVRRAEKESKLDVDSVRSILEFFREFADRCHHGKEEDLFFPLAHKRGVGCAPASLESLRAEHETGRGHVQAMAANLDAAAKGDGEAAGRFVLHARDYERLLTDHIGKEDHCLFPTADTMLTAADQESLVDSFEKLEQERMGAGMHERMLALADELAAHWGVSGAVPTSA